MYYKNLQTMLKSYIKMTTGNFKSLMFKTMINLAKKLAVKL